MDVMNDNKADQVTSESCEEECWNLGDNFNLYAKHEIGEVHFPSNPDDEQHYDNDAHQHHSFKIECIEPDSPLDINNLTQSSRQYDATGHCVWAGAFLLIQCIHELEKYIILEAGDGDGDCSQSQHKNHTGIGGLAMLLVNNKSIVPSHVCFTDNDPAALQVCERNCKLNQVPEAAYSIRELTWEEEEEEEDEIQVKEGGDDALLFDIALATDVLYDVDLIKPLFTTVSKCIPSGGKMILSHIPRACYNECNNPPEAVEDLEKYIIDQAVHYNLHLVDIIRPPKDERDFVPEILDWCPVTSFVGGGILIFHRA